MNHPRMTRAVLSAVGALLLAAHTATAQSSMAGGSMGMDKMGHDDGMQSAGMFHGVSGRVVLGHMTMAMKDGRSMIRFAPDFKIEQNKNIDVVLSAGEMYSATSSMTVGKLGRASGKQEFTLPSGTMVDHFGYALLRDRSTGSVVGMAKLPAMGMMKEDGMMKHDSGMMKKPGGGN